MKNIDANIKLEGRTLSLLGSFVLLLRQRGLVELFHKVFSLWRREGLHGIYFRMAMLSSNYKQWVKLFGSLNSDDRVKIHKHILNFKERPVISILMPTFNSSEHWLRLAIDSVRSQLYPHWELCIADDASTAENVRVIIEEYVRLDARIRVTYRTTNGHISNASNSALELAQGQFVGLLDHDDLLAEHALYMVVCALNSNPKLNLIFSDEDKIGTDGRRFEPCFKSDWNPELMRCQNAVSHFGVYRADVIRALDGFRVGFEGSQDWDLALRVSEHIAPDTIHHIPHVLYHWRVHPDSTASDVRAKPYVIEAGQRAVQDHLNRCGLNADILPHPQLSGQWHRVRYALPPSPPLVSIIIPTRNGLHLLKRCIDTLLDLTDYPNYEIIIVDNQSDDPATLNFLKEKTAANEIRIYRYDAPFNYSAINNAAVNQANGELLCFLNNDVEITECGWLTELASHAARPGIGAVGARLLYPDGHIQHAGVILGIGGVAAHIYIGSAKSEIGPMGRAAFQQNFSAVTAACLVVGRMAFDRVHGFDEDNLPVSFNDVDFCLRLIEAGYQNIWTPHATLIHHESATRGRDNTPEKKLRFSKEIAYMQQHWAGLLLNDPAFNPNYSLDYAFPLLSFPPRAELPWKRQQ